jgi:hypothetical protein
MITCTSLQAFLDSIQIKVFIYLFIVLTFNIGSVSLKVKIVICCNSIDSINDIFTLFLNISLRFDIYFYLHIVKT